MKIWLSHTPSCQLKSAINVAMRQSVFYGVKFAITCNLFLIIQQLTVIKGQKAQTGFCLHRQKLTLTLTFAASSSQYSQVFNQISIFGVPVLVSIQYLHAKYGNTLLYRHPPHLSLVFTCGISSARTNGSLFACNRPVSVSALGSTLQHTKHDKFVWTYKGNDSIRCHLYSPKSQLCFTWCGH